MTPTDMTPITHIPPCSKCGHAWHGLPCRTCAAMVKLDEQKDECPTSCENVPTIPKSMVEHLVGEDE